MSDTPVAVVAPPQRLRRLSKTDGSFEIPPSNAATFYAAVRRQLDWESAAWFAGIPWPYLLWVAKQADLYPDGPAAAFLEETSRAVAEGKTSLVSKLYQSEDPRWAAWLLERKFPEEFGRRVEISGPRDRTLSELDKRLAAQRIAEAEDEFGVDDVD